MVVEEGIPGLALDATVVVDSLDSDLGARHSMAVVYCFLDSCIGFLVGIASAAVVDTADVDLVEDTETDSCIAGCHGRSHLRSSQSLTFLQLFSLLLRTRWTSSNCYAKW